MKKISASEFYAMIEKNPSIFEHWNTPLEIIEYVDCRSSKITHLSPHLTFTGKNENELSAFFSNCKSLQIATGNFRNWVSFQESEIQKIEELTADACVFYNCKSLQVATGTFKTWVDFQGSGIHSIKNLILTQPEFISADFRDCVNLHNLEGWDLSKKIDIEPEKLQSERKRRDSLKNFIQETKPKELPFL
jgi:hypothetical protein